MVKESDSQEIDRLGNISFRFHIPKNWIISLIPEYDFGIDYAICSKKDVGLSVGRWFFVQLKTISKAKIKNNHVSVKFHAKNIVAYNEIGIPLMIIYCDLGGYRQEPEKSILYYSWYSEVAINPNQKSYSIKIPVTNRLHRNLNINDEYENYLRSLNIKEFYNKTLPKKFIPCELINNYSYKISTNHVSLSAFLPCKENSYQGSCLIIFAIEGTDNCMITFSHKSILKDLFCGILNNNNYLNRKIIIGECSDNSELIQVQLGNCRYLLQKKYVCELCYVIDRLYYQYIKYLQNANVYLKLLNFKYNDLFSGFQLATVPMKIWAEILLIAKEFSYEKSCTEWNVFDMISDSFLFIKTFDKKRKTHNIVAKLSAFKDSGTNVLDSSNNVLIIWRYPGSSLHDDIENIWSIEACYDWFFEKLLPFAVEHGKNRCSAKMNFQNVFTRKKYHSIFHYIDKHGYSNWIRGHNHSRIIDKNTITDHIALKTFVTQVHYHYARHCGSELLCIGYSKQNVISFYNALVLCFEYTNNYDVFYLNNKLFHSKNNQNIRKDEFITSIKTSKFNELDSAIIEYELRVYKKLLEDSTSYIPTDIVKKIAKELLWLYLIVENNLLLENFSKINFE